MSMYKTLLVAAAGMLLSFGSYAAKVPGPSAQLLVENIVQKDDAYFNQHVVFPRHAQIKHPNAPLVKREPLISVKGVVPSKHSNILASNSHKRKYKLKPFVRKPSGVELSYRRDYKKMMASRRTYSKRKNIVRSRQVQTVRLPAPMKARGKLVVNHKPKFRHKTDLLMAKARIRPQYKFARTARTRRKFRYQAANVNKMRATSKYVAKLPEPVAGEHHKRQQRMRHAMNRKRFVPAHHKQVASVQKKNMTHRTIMHRKPDAQTRKVVKHYPVAYLKHVGRSPKRAKHLDAVHHKHVAKSASTIVRHQKPTHHAKANYDLPRLRVVKNRDFFPPLMSTPKRFHLRQAKKVSSEPMSQRKKVTVVHGNRVKRMTVAPVRWSKKMTVARIKRRVKKITASMARPMKKRQSVNVVIKKPKQRVFPHSRRAMKYRQPHKALARKKVKHSLPMRKMIEQKMTQHRGHLQYKQQPKIISRGKTQYHQPTKEMAKKQMLQKKQSKIVVGERGRHAKKPFQLHGFKVIPHPAEILHHPKPMKMFFKLEKTYS